jgi:hypothetical protein
MAIELINQPYNIIGLRPIMGTPLASYDTIRHSDSIIITQIYNIIGLRPIMGTRLASYDAIA